MYWLKGILHFWFVFGLKEKGLSDTWNRKNEKFVGKHIVVRSLREIFESKLKLKQERTIFSKKKKLLLLIYNIREEICLKKWIKIIVALIWHRLCKEKKCIPLSTSLHVEVKLFCGEKKKAKTIKDRKTNDLFFLLPFHPVAWFIFVAWRDCLTARNPLLNKSDSYEVNISFQFSAVHCSKTKANFSASTKALKRNVRKIRSNLDFKSLKLNHLKC